MDSIVPTPLPAPAQARPRGCCKRWGFRLAVLLMLAVVAEATSYVGYWIAHGRPFSYGRDRHERQRLLWAANGEDAQQGATPTFRTEIHPYLGFSYDPDAQAPGLRGEAPANDYGFTDRAGRSPVRKRAPNKAIVAITGASVASIFVGQGLDVLERELKQSPEFSGKEIEFVSLAVGGFRQPQQVMALNYVLALGGEFDVLVNIDGLNEVAWYRQDNQVHGIHHLYPGGWHWIVSKMPDRASRRAVGKMAYLGERRHDLANLFQKAPLRWSVTANFIWKWQDRRLHADVVNTETALRARKREGPLPYRARGPHHPFRDDQEMLEALVGDWERCSLLLHKTCAAHGIRYYQFLQPNQYVPGSKVLTAEEKKTAILEPQPARPMIEQGYPMLREAGKRLQARGVKFHDLSMVFAAHKQTLYFDTCCHFNREGNEVLAVPIARALVETREPPRTASR